MNNSSSSNDNPSGVQGVCPTGWHVPSNAEWTQLTDYVSSQSDYICGNSNSNVAKSLSTKIGWNSDTTTCAVGNDPDFNNATGFSAVPAGDRSFNITTNLGKKAHCWCTTASPGYYGDYRGAYFFSLGYNNKVASIGAAVKWYGFAVRCVRD